MNRMYQTEKIAVPNPALFRIKMNRHHDGIT